MLLFSSMLFALTSVSNLSCKEEQRTDRQAYAHRDGPSATSRNSPIEDMNLEKSKESKRVQLENKNRLEAAKWFTIGRQISQCLFCPGSVVECLQTPVINLYHLRGSAILEKNRKWANDVAKNIEEVQEKIERLPKGKDYLVNLTKEMRSLFSWLKDRWDISAGSSEVKMRRLMAIGLYAQLLSDTCFHACDTNDLAKITALSFLERSEIIEQKNLVEVLDENNRKYLSGIRQAAERCMAPHCESDAVKKAMLKLSRALGAPMKM